MVKIDGAIGRRQLIYLGSRREVRPAVIADHAGRLKNGGVALGDKLEMALHSEDRYFLGIRRVFNAESFKWNFQILASDAQNREGAIEYLNWASSEWALSGMPWQYATRPVFRMTCLGPKAAEYRNGFRLLLTIEDVEIEQER